jgi:hypothetical protein
MPGPLLPTRQRYARVLASVAVAAVVRLLLGRFLHANGPFFTFVPAVVYSAWVAGFGGGLLATGLSAAIAEYAIFLPTGAFIVDPASRVLFAGFFVLGFCISLLGHSQMRITELAVTMAEHEHAIARRLQEALQPSVFDDLPGLQVTAYYRAALDEAEIGGDFYDAFAGDDGIAFLVVGDVVGKGLAAASEIATLRNMLRFGLYNGRSLSGPAERLNRNVFDHRLLAGFATVFVGRYDVASRTLTYVNCGQEPALVRRAATGVVDELRPTGMVLGVERDSPFAEATVILAPGDAVAIFTDGLTEVGPSRRELFGVDGVAGCVMAGVEAFGGAVPRDDQCLLVAIARP